MKNQKKTCRASVLSKQQPNIYDSANIAHDDLTAGSKQIFHEEPVLRKTLSAAWTRVGCWPPTSAPMTLNHSRPITTHLHHKSSDTAAAAETDSSRNGTTAQCTTTDTYRRLLSF